MTTVKSLSETFDAFAVDTAALSQQAIDIVSTVPADKAECALEMAAVATAMSNMANRIANTLRGSLLHSKKAA